MAKTTPKLKRIIKRFRSQLEQMGIHPERVMLYGSQAAGTAREGSDIDLIVISGDWKSTTTGKDWNYWVLHLQEFWSLSRHRDSHRAKLS